MADTKISDLAAATSLADTDLFVIAQEDTANKKVTFPILRDEVLSGARLFDAYALIREEQTSGTDGGSASATTWHTRVLNTESTDPSGVVSISSNQFTLAAGTYWIEARAPAYAVNRHKLRVRNITDGSDALIGSSHYSGGSGDNMQTEAVLRGRLTIAASKAFELQHYTQTASATIGLGVATSASVTEIYAEVEIWREA